MSKPLSEYFHSEFVTITLKDDPSAKPFYVHKELLGSASQEFHKHIFNELKEGLQNALQLEDVDTATMKHFLSWLYTKSYSICTEEEQESVQANPKSTVVVQTSDINPPNPQQNSFGQSAFGQRVDTGGSVPFGSTNTISRPLFGQSRPSSGFGGFGSMSGNSSAFGSAFGTPAPNPLPVPSNEPEKTVQTDGLLIHAKLHVFADRFNIPTLKSLTSKRIFEILVQCPQKPSSQTRKDISAVITYCTENLPINPSSANEKELGEDILGCLADYVAWALATFRQDKPILALLTKELDFITLLLERTKAGDKPNWIK